MEDLSRTYRTSVKNTGANGGKAYNGSNIFVVQSNPLPLLIMPTPYSVKAATPRLASPSRSKPWLESQDLKRKKRIAKYKFYGLEGKVKKSFKKGIRWIKHTCNKIVHGF